MTQKYGEKFLTKNAGYQTTITGNMIEMLSTYRWNTAYGVIQINPTEAPNGEFKWDFCVSKSYDVFFCCSIGLSSDRKLRNALMSESESDANLSWYRRTEDGVIIGSDIDKDEYPKGKELEEGDAISVIVSVKSKSLTYLVAGQSQTVPIDTSYNYYLAISMCACTLKFENFACIKDPEILIAGFLKDLNLTDKEFHYDDIINIICGYFRFFS